MTDRVAIVVGAGGTIGGACAQELVAAADLIACVDLDAERAAHTVEALTASGASAVGVIADASAPEFSAAVLAALPEAATVTAAVHAVAHEEHTPAVDVSRESVLRSFTMGPLAAFELFRDLVRGGRVRRGSALTVIGSLHATHPIADCVGYNAAHAALVQMVRTLAHEWAPLGVRVNAVAPGWIRTDAESAFYGDEHLDRLGSQLPFGRFGTAADVAAAVGYLSTERAGYVSGSVLTVDGALGVSMARLPTEANP